MWFYYLVMAIGVSVGTGAFVAYNAEQKANLAIVHEEPEVNAEQAAKVSRALRRMYQVNPGAFPSPRGNNVRRIPQRLIDQALAGGLAAPAGIIFEINSSGQILTRVNPNQTDINAGGYQTAIDRIGVTPNTETMNRNSRTIPGSGTYDFINEEGIPLNNTYRNFGDGVGRSINEPSNGFRSSDDDTFRISGTGVTVTPIGGTGGHTGTTVDPIDSPGGSTGNGTGDTGGTGGTGGGGNTPPDDGGSTGDSDNWRPLPWQSQFTNPTDRRYPYERRVDTACVDISKYNPRQMRITRAAYTEALTLARSAEINRKYDELIAGHQEWHNEWVAADKAQAKGPPKTKRKNDPRAFAHLLGSRPAEYLNFRYHYQARNHYNFQRDDELEGIAAKAKADDDVLFKGIAALFDVCDDLLHRRLQQQNVEIQADTASQTQKNSLAIAANNLRTKTNLYKEPLIYASGDKHMMRAESWIEAVIDGSNAILSYPVIHKGK